MKKRSVINYVIKGEVIWDGVVEGLRSVLKIDEEFTRCSLSSALALEIVKSSLSN